MAHTLVVQVQTLTCKQAIFRGTTLRAYGSQHQRPSWAKAIGAIVIGLAWLICATSSAKAAALEDLKSGSYQFILEVHELVRTYTCHALMDKSGMLRIGTEQDGLPVNSVVDLKGQKAMLIWPQQKMVQINKLDVPAKDLYKAVHKSVMSGETLQELWALKQADNQPFEAREVDGHQAQGYQIKQETDLAVTEYLIWRDAKSSLPVRVEISTTIKAMPQLSNKVVIHGFQAIENPDPKLFSMEVPEGYTLGNTMTLDQLRASSLEHATTRPTATDEAVKILNAMQRWNTKQEQDQAISELMDVNWDRDFQFGVNAPFFSMTEREFAQLTHEDQRKLIEQINGQLNPYREVAVRLQELAQQATDPAEAERYLRVAMHLGEQLDQDHRMLVVQLVGIGVKNLAAKDLASLYEKNGQADKQQQMLQEIEALKQHAKDLKKGVLGM